MNNKKIASELIKIAKSLVAEPESPDTSIIERDIMSLGYIERAEVKWHKQDPNEVSVFVYVKPNDMESKWVIPARDEKRRYKRFKEGS
jgi:hypothetical protein